MARSTCLDAQWSAQICMVRRLLCSRLHWTFPQTELLSFACIEYADGCTCRHVQASLTKGTMWITRVQLALCQTRVFGEIYTSEQSRRIKWYICMNHSMGLAHSSTFPNSCFDIRYYLWLQGLIEGRKCCNLTPTTWRTF